MKTAFHIVLRSWQLPWQEKSLLFVPVLLFVAIYASEYLAQILGLDSLSHPLYIMTSFKLIPSIFYRTATSALIYLLMAALSVAIALRALNEHEVNLDQILSDLRLRAGSLLAFAFLIEFLSLMPNIAPFFLASLPHPAVWDHDLSLRYMLLSTFYLLLVKALFLLALPTLVNEKGRFLHLLWRSWQHSSKIIGTILTSVIGLLFTLTLLGVAFVILDAILGVGVIRPEGMGPAASSPLDGFLLRNYQRLLVLPVCWSYQALLYRHARDPEPT